MELDLGLDLRLSGEMPAPSALPDQPAGTGAAPGRPCAAPGSQPSLPSLPSQVHHILQEVVIGGMVLETNMNEIVAQVEAQSKLEKAEVSGDAAALPAGVGSCRVWVSPVSA